MSLSTRLVRISLPSQASSRRQGVVEDAEPRTQLGSAARTPLAAAFIVACVLSCWPRAEAGFITAPTYRDPNPFADSLAVADFNGDGIPDVVITKGGDFPGVPGTTISVLLGKGDGTFQAPQYYEVGPDPISVAVADFNGDGIPDIVVARLGSLANGHTDGGGCILLGNGDGTFQPPHAFAFGPSLASVAVGDFNGDGVPDLAVANYYGKFVRVLLGNGDGTFRGSRNYGVDGAPLSVVVADFNQDGTPDLAVGGLGGLKILLGNGDGSFQAGQTYGDGSDPYGLTVGDFNRDGIPDLATARESGVTIFLGNGDGTFQALQNYVLAIRPASVTAADLNGDGILDLAVAANGLTVMLGNGDGTFRQGQTYAPGAVSVAVGDFNQDGIPDLVGANSNFHRLGAVTLLLGKGDGTFQAARCYPTAGVASEGNSLAVADFNHDGIPDIAAASSYGPSAISILLGNGDGTFQRPSSFAAGLGPNCVAVGDFNGDGKADLVTTNVHFTGNKGNYRIVESDVRVFLGNGDGTFQAVGVYQVTGGNPGSVVVGDLNGDGVPDLAVANGSWSQLFGGSTVSILLGNGDGTFQASVSYDIGYAAQSIAIGDFNGDGHPDLALVSGLGLRTGGRLSILLGNGDGTLQSQQDYAVGDQPQSVAVGDFNGDGVPDLAMADLDGTMVIVMLGNGDGTFGREQDYALAGPTTFIAIGDYNRDGFPDLAVANGYTVAVLLNAADWGP